MLAWRFRRQPRKLFDEDPTRFYPSRWAHAEAGGAYQRREAVDLQPVAHHGSIEATPHGLQVTTPAQAWGYAASQALPRLHDGETACEVEITAHEGELVMTLADDSLESVGEQIVIQPGSTPRKIILRDRTRRTLLFRTGEQPISATATLHAVTMLA